MIQSGAAIAATNWDVTSNFMAGSGSTASRRRALHGNYVSSDPRGNRIALNDILVYPAPALSYGILVDGTHESSNTVQGNHVQGNGLLLLHQDRGWLHCERKITGTLPASLRT